VVAVTVTILRGTVTIHREVAEIPALAEKEAIGVKIHGVVLDRVLMIFAVAIMAAVAVAQEQVGLRHLATVVLAV
jgi:hypothetical protein